MAREKRDKTLLAFGGGRFQGILRIAALKSTQCVLRKEQRKMKLIIWDFDGVTADTEKYWLAIELEELNKYCGFNMPGVKAQVTDQTQSIEQIRERYQIAGQTTDQPRLEAPKADF